MSDAPWEQVCPLLPPPKPRTGRQNRDHRAEVNAIVWIARTGDPWRNLPARDGSWTTSVSRFSRWRATGI